MESLQGSVSWDRVQTESQNKVLDSAHGQSLRAAGQRAFRCC